MLKPEKHKHGVGERRDKCINCQLTEIEDRMSAFETACWAWYVDNVTPFMLEAGLTAESFRELGLSGAARRIFVMGLNRIHGAFARVKAERARDSMRK